MTARAAGLARICAPLALITLLAACNGGTEAPPPLTTPAGTTPAKTSEPPGPTASPTVAAPTKPAAADNYTPDGMKAFVQYAIETVNHAYATGDVRPLNLIATKNCDSCKSIRREVTAVWGRGGRTAGSQASILRMDAPPPEGRKGTVFVALRISKYVEYDDKGKIQHTTRAVQEVQYLFDLVRQGERWKLDGVRRVLR